PPLISATLPASLFMTALLVSECRAHASRRRRRGQAVVEPRREPLAESAREVAPDDVASALRRHPTLVDHSPGLGRHEIEEIIAPHICQPVRAEDAFDLFPRSAAEKWQLVSDGRVFLARASILRC